MADKTINDIVEAGRFFTQHARKKKIQKLHDLAHTVNSQLNAAEMALDLSNNPRMPENMRINKIGAMEECHHQTQELLPSTQELKVFFPDVRERRLAGEATQQLKEFQKRLRAALEAEVDDVSRRR